MNNSRPTFVNRFILPGLAFKACVIGGGYATGRELVEFFLSSGPVNGLKAMLVAMSMWSLICAGTFAFAFQTKRINYKDFFCALLGRYGVVFEIIYFGLTILVLSVFGAAAGEIGKSLFDLPRIVGTVAIATAILGVAYSGQTGVERLFKYVSILLYVAYAAFFVVTLSKVGGDIKASFRVPGQAAPWLANAVSFCSYNVIGAVMILPVLRHQTRTRDAVVAGLLSGPLAMLPALAFFICLLPFYPRVLAQALPSDYVLNSLDVPMLRYGFQAMIFFALLESGVGFVQAFLARIDPVLRGLPKPIASRLRVLVLTAMVLGPIFAADGIGLVTLIGKGYRMSGYAVVLIYVLPLLLVAFPKIVRNALGRWTRTDRAATTHG